MEHAAKKISSVGQWRRSADMDQGCWTTAAKLKTAATISTIAASRVLGCNARGSLVLTPAASVR